MFDQLTERLIYLRGQLRQKNRLQDSLNALSDSLDGEKSRLNELEVQLTKEGRDVEKLEGMSLTGLFYSILGSKEEQLDKEKQEYLAAKLKYDNCIEAIKHIESDIKRLRSELYALGDVENEYEKLYCEKERLIKKSDNPASRRLMELTEIYSSMQSEEKEINEALSAGNAALSGLGNVIEALESAKGWGTWDMLGGGLISTAIKHSRIDEARNHANQVQQLLIRFQQELQDVNIQDENSIVLQISSFSTFADFFFDGLIADWIVQSKINDSLESAKNMRYRVQGIIDLLQQKLSQIGTTLENQKSEINTAIEEM